MYGMMPSAKIVALGERPAHEQVVQPEQRAAPALANAAASACAFTPGVGHVLPSR